MNRLAWLAAGTALLLDLGLIGCGRGGPEIVPIEGTVTHNGKPVPNLRVYFFPTEGRFSWGISDEQGRFSLSYDPDHRGAKVGTHTISVVDESANVHPTAAMSGAPRPKRAPDTAEILAKYGDRQTSPLKVEVTKADKNFQFKLD